MRKVKKLAKIFSLKINKINNNSKISINHKVYIFKVIFARKQEFEKKYFDFWKLHTTLYRIMLGSN